MWTSRSSDRSGKSKPSRAAVPSGSGVDFRSSTGVVGGGRLEELLPNCTGTRRTETGGRNSRSRGCCLHHDQVAQEKELRGVLVKRRVCGVACTEEDLRRAPGYRSRAQWPVTRSGRVGRGLSLLALALRAAQTVARAAASVGGCWMSRGDFVAERTPKNDGQEDRARST